MKTIRLLLLIAAIVSIACISCSKYEAEESNVQEFKDLPALPNVIDENSIPIQKTWTENFENQFSLNSNWKLYGTPLPKWVATAYGNQGLFDNNGASPNKSHAVSNRIVGKRMGYVVESEVMVKILDIFGNCVCPGIAVSQEIVPKVNKDNEIPTSISMKIVFAGVNATWFPAKYRGHTFFMMEFLGENNNRVSSGYIFADQYSNSWHKLKIEVTANRYTRFYCDNNLIWAPFERLNPEMMSDRKVILGYTSDGDPNTFAGIAYHNWVKATYPVGPEL